MKKFLFLMMVLALTLLAACGQTGEGTSSEQDNSSNNSEEVQEQKVTIKISKDQKAEQLDEKEVVIEEGAVLLDVMEENFDLETAYEGTFITGIDGVIANEAEKYSWMFYVNGEMAQKGASETVLKAGDVVEFDLQKWE